MTMFGPGGGFMASPRLHQNLIAREPPVAELPLQIVGYAWADPRRRVLDDDVWSRRRLHGVASSPSNLALFAHRQSPSLYTHAMPLFVSHFFSQPRICATDGPPNSPTHAAPRVTPRDRAARKITPSLLTSSPHRVGGGGGHRYEWACSRGPLP